MIAGAIIVVVVTGLWPAFNIYPVIGLALGIVLRSLFFQTRYVIGFEIKEEVLHVKYITPFFTECTYQKPLIEITDIKLDNADELSIVTTGKWESFDLATNKIKQDIEAKVNSANLVFKNLTC